MKSNSSLVCVIISLLLFCHSTKARSLAQSDTVVAHATAEKWREDLRYLAQEMPKRHKNLFPTMTRVQFEEAIKILDGRIPSLTRQQIIVEFERIVAMVQDGHTRMQGFPFDPKIGFHSYPLALYLYKNGLFVRAADRTYIDAVGARIVKIGNASAERALNTVRELVCRDNEMGVQASAPLLLVTPEVLHAVGLVDDIENAKFVIERDGRQKTITLKPASGQELVSYALLRQKPENWVEARDHASAPVPLWLRDPRNNFWFEYLADSRILYVQYNAVEDKENETVADFAKRLFEFVDAHPVDRFVIDLRWNGGGNNQLNRPLLLGIIKANKIDQPGRLFAIIGRNTFSAAQSFVDELEEYTNAIFVGEPTAENVNQYGDPVGIVLPNSGITVRVSTLWWQYMDPRDTRQWTPPLISTPLTAEDYRDNIDPAMKAIVGYVPKQTLTGQMREALAAKDLGLAITIYKTFKDDPEHEYAETEAEINKLGYELMAKKQFDQAIEILKLNVGSYPSSWNAYDSLGEAYVKGGNKELAIKSYEESLRLNADNKGAGEALIKLRSQVAPTLQEARLERIVVANKIISKRLPQVTLQFPGDMKYVGGQAFNFYGIAHAEQHFFVDADKNGIIQRMYSVQFESFLPGTSDAYDYKTPDKLIMGNLEFLVDTRVRPVTHPSPDSDAGHAISFLEGKGLHFADENLRARFIHLPDATKRNELMILYQENLAPTGLRASDLSTDGAKADKWPDMARALIARASKGVVIK